MSCEISLCCCRHPEGFVGMGCGGKNMTMDRLRDMVSRRFQQLRKGNFNGANGPITVELMVHPGYPAAPTSGGCGEGPDSFAQCPDRQLEMDVLTSKEFLAFCDNYVKVSKLRKVFP